MVPNEEIPFSVVVEWDWWKAQFETKKLKMLFPQTQFGGMGITEQDIEDTLLRAGSLV